MSGHARELVKAVLFFTSAVAAAQSASDKPSNPDQSLLTPVLRAATSELTGMMESFVDVSAVEEIHEARFRAPGIFRADRRENARYFMRAAAANAPVPVEELRTIAKPEADGGFFLSTGFEGTLNH